MNEEFCENCDKKDCAKCNKKKRFSVQSICNETCIFDNLTENIYTKNDLHLICELLNRGKYEI